MCYYHFQTLGHASCLRLHTTQRGGKSFLMAASFIFIDISVSYSIRSYFSKSVGDTKACRCVFTNPLALLLCFWEGKKTFIIVIAIIFVVCLKGSSHFSVCLGACCGKANNVSDAPLHLSITYPFHYSTDNLSSTDI